jgi:prepilin-type N-terminal cleavage/methylation domain-containing protein
MNFRNVNGFTLVEILVATAIVSVLTSVSVDEYGQHMRDTHVTATKNMMLVNSMKLEKIKNKHFSYSPAANQMGFPKEGVLELEYNVNEVLLYRLAYIINSDYYTVTAVPNNKSPLFSNYDIPYISAQVFADNSSFGGMSSFYESKFVDGRPSWAKWDIR